MNASRERHTEPARWLVVVVFAIAMAWVESAVVFYLRTMVNRIEPYQPNPLPISTGLGLAEIVREFATMIMLVTVGWLAGRTWRHRFAYALLAFGVWDIFYYVWLRGLTGWPHSLLDWDVLFLIPLPWWGPVLAPMCIALLMVIWGTLVTQFERFTRPLCSNWKFQSSCAGGVALALFVFMADALRVADGGSEALRNMLPVSFNWPLFVVALVLMAVPVLGMIWDLRRDGASKQELNHAKWLAHFACNRENRPEPNWTAPITIRPEVIPSLVRSLEQYQLGDGGGPASLIAFDAERFRSRTGELRAIVDAWFSEEREHARLLGCAVDRFGGQRITGHWSFTAFCLCRRAFGVVFELQVLLLTEIVSTAYYRLLRRHGDDSVLRAMCSLIIRDEAAHILFHCDRLTEARRSPRGVLGGIWAMQFKFFGYAAATMLWLNHRRCLTALGGTRAAFYREVRRELRRFLARLARQAEQQPCAPAAWAALAPNIS